MYDSSDTILFTIHKLFRVSGASGARCSISACSSLFAPSGPAPVGTLPLEIKTPHQLQQRFKTEAPSCRGPDPAGFVENTRGIECFTAPVIELLVWGILLRMSFLKKHILRGTKFSTTHHLRTWADHCTRVPLKNEYSINLFGISPQTAVTKLSTRLWTAAVKLS
eukprot:SAG31_NODE_1654_length_7621_cov_3.273597_2_plen_165_part_00